MISNEMTRSAHSGVSRSSQGAAPDNTSLPTVREIAERRFRASRFGPHDAGLIGALLVNINLLKDFHDHGFGT
jgi:hypothetical protein